MALNWGVSNPASNLFIESDREGISCSIGVKYLLITVKYNAYKM